MLFSVLRYGIFVLFVVSCGLVHAEPPKHGKKAKVVRKKKPQAGLVRFLNSRPDLAFVSLLRLSPRRPKLRKKLEHLLLPPFNQVARWYQRRYKPQPTKACFSIVMNFQGSSTSTSLTLQKNVLKSTVLRRYLTRALKRRHKQITLLLKRHRVQAGQITARFVMADNIFNKQCNQSRLHVSPMTGSKRFKKMY